MHGLILRGIFLCRPQTTVYQPFAVIQRRCYAGSVQSLGIQHAVIAQRIELRHGDEGRWQSVKISGEQRHRIRSRLSGTAQIKRVVAIHIAAAQ
ncbi:hypothetical protein D3C76_1640120 [compost metagenome]